VGGHIYDQEGAEDVAQSVGLKVRSLMRETGRTLPEDLPAAEDIEQVIERVSESEKQLIEPPLKEPKHRIQENSKDADSPEQISLLD
jgi:hypothetical protein